MLVTNIARNFNLINRIFNNALLIILAKSRSTKETNLDLYLNNTIIAASFVIVEVHSLNKVFYVAFKVGKDVENAVKVVTPKVNEFVSSSAFVQADDFLKVGNEKFVVRKVPHGVLVVERFLEIFQCSTESIFVFHRVLINGFSEGEIDHRNISRNKQLLHLIDLSSESCSFLTLFGAFLNQLTNSNLYLRQ